MVLGELVQSRSNGKGGPPNLPGTLHRQVYLPAVDAYLCLCNRNSFQTQEKTGTSNRRLAFASWGWAFTQCKFRMLCPRCNSGSEANPQDGTSPSPVCTESLSRVSTVRNRDQARGWS